MALSQKENSLSRLSERFDTLKQKGEKALICFVTAGDPSAEATADIVAALADAGADAVEIGLPYSDPLADGPSIQAASQRSLDGGMSVLKALEIVRQIRRKTPDLPLILMTYYNPILRYGLERYARDAREAGADAHIVTDLTPEESDDWRRISQANGLDTIFLLAPTSTADRIEIVARIASGFVYCVSRTGVTGARQDVPAELAVMINQIKAKTETPVCIGFGISQPEHVQKIAAISDGAIVGSSLVDLIHKNRADARLLDAVREYVHALKQATK